MNLGLGLGLTIHRILGASAGSGMVPYFIATGETFTVSEYKQALFVSIDCEGSLVVDGYLEEV